jgi:hypothetical protein
MKKIIASASLDFGSMQRVTKNLARTLFSFLRVRERSIVERE